MTQKRLPNPNPSAKRKLEIAPPVVIPASCTQIVTAANEGKKVGFAKLVSAIATPKKIGPFLLILEA